MVLVQSILSGNSVLHSSADKVPKPVVPVWNLMATAITYLAEVIQPMRYQLQLVYAHEIMA